ncbi:hypothetical protein FKW77_005110 [Venturia effusa]|uniref:Uncharacterized protein n=1 Tax=Venturia effusa TaxID=50376 RepID=A0A517KWB2_9PEZI|nr:hypothetical protein FKW77_005110 [Venturia effusa]
MACREYNNRAEDCSPEERAVLWNSIVCPKGQAQASGFPPPLRSPSTVTATFVQADPDNTGHEASSSANRAFLESLPTSPASSHSLEYHLHDYEHAGHQAASRPGSSSTSKMHSPPPSPGSHSFTKTSHNTGIASLRVSTNTPPASRKASPSSFPGRGDAHVCEEVAVSASAANPFDVNVPYIKPPLYIDYGTNLSIGATTFINRNFTVLDSPILRVSIGEGCLIGPNTTLASITHPLDANERAGPLGAPSFASEISIGNNCWIGASVQILDGVKIGDGCVIGAGSVVTKDIPAGHLALGTPARINRRVTSDAADRQNAIDSATVLPVVPTTYHSETDDPAERGTAIILSPRPILSPSDLVTHDEVCHCRGQELQRKVERLEKAVALLSIILLVCAAKSLFT